MRSAKFNRHGSVSSWVMSVNPRFHASSRSLPALQSETPYHGGRAFFIEESGDDLLSRASCTLSSARERFTVLFGKGRGGSTPLWSPDITGVLMGLSHQDDVRLS